MDLATEEKDLVLPLPLEEEEEPLDEVEPTKPQSQHFPEIPEELVDVTLMVEEGQLHVSRTILAHYSPVFHKMFFSDFKEKSEATVPLPGEKFDEMVTFLDLLFSSSPDSQLVTDENLISLLQLADKYDTQRVRACCLEYIKDQLFLFYHNFYNEFTKTNRVHGINTISKDDVSGQDLGPTGTKELPFATGGNSTAATFATGANFNVATPNQLGFSFGPIPNNQPTIKASPDAQKKEYLRDKLVLYLKAYEYIQSTQLKHEILSLFIASCRTMKDISGTRHYASLSLDSKVEILEQMCQTKLG